MTGALTLRGFELGIMLSE